MACAALRGGAFPEAVDALERILEDDVEAPGASSALKCASFWREHLDGERAGKGGFERGERLLALWRLFQSFAERLPDVSERILFAIKQHVFSSALACYEEAVPAGTDGGDPDVLLQAGRCCKGTGNYERAVELLERANRERRDDARILAELADCYSLVNEARAAKAFFREAFFVDPQSVDLPGLEAPLIRRLSRRLAERGYTGAELAEWIPVFGAAWGVFNVKRELKPLEFGKLKQGIYQLEKDLRAADAAGSTVLAPRLINRYMWLIDHYMATGEPRERIDEVLARIREIDPAVHAEYTT
jgi:tetratricopeptide (TPR) repeat protein